MKKISLIVGLICLLLTSAHTFCYAQTAGTAEAELKAILDAIPNWWWDGGWDKLNELKDFISKHPDKPALCAQAQYYIGCYYYSIRNNDAAIRAYDTVISAYPSADAWRAKAQYEIAQIYLNCLHQPEAAIREYEKVLSNYQDMNLKPVAQLMIGKAYLELENYPEAEASFKKVITDYPQAKKQHSEVYLGLGDLSIQVGSSTSDKSKVSQAISYYKKAYLTCPQDEPGLLDYIIGKLYEAFKALDNSVARANTFVKYQKYGPQGEDGISGTKDDLTDPLTEF